MINERCLNYINVNLPFNFYQKMVQISHLLKFWLNFWVWNIYGLVQGELVWLPTKILESTLSDAILQASAPCRSLYCASRYCQLTGYCYLFCHESEGSFSLWKILASPNMNEDATEGVKNCWTNRPSKNFIPALSGVSIRGTSANNHASKRIIENLVDGIYKFQENSAYHAHPGTYTYFVIDLGRQQMVEKIILYPASPSLNRFEKLSICVGNHEVTDDFSSYKEIYYYDGPIPDASFVLTIDLNVPEFTRYISAQIMDDSQTELHIAHVEIFLTNPEDYEQSLVKYDV